MSKTPCFHRVFFLIVLMAYIQACGIVNQTAPNQNQQSGLLLLLQPGDFNPQIKWNTDWASPEYKINEDSKSFERAIRIFSGQLDNHSLVNFEHDLLCYEESPSLEIPSGSNVVEIELDILEYGDKSTSFCYQPTDTQIVFCSTETLYSNLISRIAVWVEQDSSNTKLLEELVNTALTVTNDRVLENTVCE